MDFSTLVQPDRGQPAHAIVVVHPDDWPSWLAAQTPRVRSAIAAHQTAGKPGSKAILLGDGADDWSALMICDEPATSPWRIASLPAFLPPGTYRLATGSPDAAMLGWLLGQYRFDRYRRPSEIEPRVLLSPEGSPTEEASRLAAATALVRDLVNTGAGDLGPAQLEAEVASLGRRHGAQLTVTSGDALANDYPLIHAVGRAATPERAPRLVELEWGDPAHPRVAIIGKGVCFDTGGLDIKPSAGMRLMKKDMGGAAHALALSDLVMAAGLKLRLHLLIPAVENAVGPDSFRPGDVLPSRAGLSVENTNTDAEGRLVLADAFTRAGEERPALMLDFATLTGAARVALGPDLPPLFTDDEALASELLAAGTEHGDPLWRMPLWDGYDDMLTSDVADLVNAPDGGMAGAVTAALFLRRFVPKGLAWAHMDVFAWRPTAKPGRPKGGDAFGIRAAYTVLKARYG